MAHAALGIPHILPIARILCLEMPSCFAFGRWPSLYSNLPDYALGITQLSLCYKTLASLVSSAILITHAKNFTHLLSQNTGLFSFKNFQFVSLTVSPIDRIDFPYQITSL